MATETLERKLAAIFYADVADYSRLTGEDEEGTHRRLSEYLDAISAAIERQGGKVLHYAGDAILADFISVVGALSCAIGIQHDLKARNEALPDEHKVQFRIGINLGDVIVDRGEIYGDGVNVAARLESLAEPGGICVSDAVRVAVGSKLPHRFESLGEQPVKNIAEPVRAYRVVLDPEAAAHAVSGKPAVRRPQRMRWAIAATTVVILLGAGAALWWQPWVLREAPASVERMAFPLPSNPSIAVLPFMNLSDDREQGYFSDGITNDIITDLSKFSTLFVIAANSTFRYKGQAVKVQQVAEDLGVRYVLEGSVQRRGDNLRINAQLIDALSGRHVWAERYDREAKDLFAVQNEITQNIVGVIYPLAEGRSKFQKEELARIARTPTNNLQAYDYFLRGIMHNDRFTKEDNQLARQMFEKAIELDSRYARASAMNTWTYLLDYWYDWTDDPQEALKKAVETALRAVKADSNEPWGH